jgi:hypothetical protein
MKTPRKRGARTPAPAYPLDLPPPGTPPSAQDLAAIWDVVIRAHYLAHELRQFVGRSGLPSVGAAFVLAEVLEDWATRFGVELEALEASRKGGDAKR